MELVVVSMTVAKIQNYIDIEINEMIDADRENESIDPLSVRAKLEQIKSMLDELEQPIEIDTEKYFEQIDKLIDKEMAQHLKDQMKRALKEEIEKGVNNDTTPTNV